MPLSVIICTHNPNHDYLTRVVDALRLQSLPTSEWELVLVDNHSELAVEGRIDLSWHPQARVVIEPLLGLTRARIRGFYAASQETLVYVDDDNVLDKYYLQGAARIADDYPFLGSWGAGVIEGVFEQPPPDWFQPFINCLCVRNIERDLWSNLTFDSPGNPVGAGLCVRRNVAEHYVRMVENNAARLQLDRVGNLLTSCGDGDLAFTACDLGQGTGSFKSLRLEHLIPASRLTLEYAERLMEGVMYSDTILRALRGQVPPPPTDPKAASSPTLTERVRKVLRPLKDRLAPPKIDRCISSVQLAARRGRSRAIDFIHDPANSALFNSTIDSVVVHD